MTFILRAIFPDSSTKATHSIEVTTGDTFGSRMDSNASIVLLSGNERSEELPLSLTFTNDFENGCTDAYFFTLPHLQKVNQIRLRRDGALSFDAWYVNRVTVKYRLTGQTSVFPVNRWIAANEELILEEYDSILPQDDKHIEQRERGLNLKRNHYRFKISPNLPGLSEELPDEEKFSVSYRFHIAKLAAKMMAGTEYQDDRNNHFKSLKDIADFYGGVLPIPNGLKNWGRDMEFANQRLSGVNPGVIRLCTELPNHMPVTSEMLAPFLEGGDLMEMLNDHKIYIVDLRYLADIKCNEGRKLVGPTALFYSRRDGTLMPLAIQLMPTPSEDNPIFLPSDPEYVWLSAKMWFNSADSSHHEAHAHLGMTHFLIEGVCLATNRQLSQSHPLYKLLAPHFLYVMAINSLATNRLVQEEGFVDEVMAMGRIGMFNIIRTKWPEWDLHRDGNLREDLKNRGVDDTDALPNYPYRDDALLMWDALHEYVSTIVKHIYDTPEKITNDVELQAWAHELANKQTGAGIGGMPTNFTSVEQIIEVVTVFIFTSSVQHAAVNFMQYDEYGYPPNYPAWLTGEPPKNKEPLVENDVVKALADKRKMIQTLIIMKILSGRATKPLGNFEVTFAYDPTSKSALKVLQGKLAAAGTMIKSSNKLRLMPYPYLKPGEIPNAISF